MAWYKTRFPIVTEILLCHIEQTSKGFQVVKMFFLHCKVNPIPTSKGKVVVSSINIYVSV